MELIIVGIIIAAAAGYTIYRLVAKPSCGCGCSCDIEKTAKRKPKNRDAHSCSCGK